MAPRAKASPSNASASSAAKPAGDQLDPYAPALESMNLILSDVRSRLIENSSQTCSQKLLQDIPILQGASALRDPVTSYEMLC